jgi:hypothetical protein
LPTHRKTRLRRVFVATRVGGMFAASGTIIMTNQGP